MQNAAQRVLVNPVSLKDCLAWKGEDAARLLDLSFVRLVIEDQEGWAAFTEPNSLELSLDLAGIKLNVLASVQTRGKGWMRLNLDKLVPSARSHMKSFLSPKKIGESLLEDARTPAARHFHGLNESELWFDEKGSLLFSYLDLKQSDLQFVMHLPGLGGPLGVGTMPRSQYIELSRVDEKLPLAPLTDGEIYQRAGESRDIITNFRPNGQREFQVKQHLLQVISEFLYSRRGRAESAELASRTL